MKTGQVRVVVIVSARQEWEAVVSLAKPGDLHTLPYGEWFTAPVNVDGREEPVAFVLGGWGKIAAAASAQYAIDRWHPQLIVNLGTCGGFEGAIERNTVILVERALVYDLIEQMGDPAAAIAHYTTDIDLSWLAEPYPMHVYRGLILSGDRDLVAEEVPLLRAQYGAVAGDWESASLAYVTARNSVRCLILRGVTDLVGPSGGEAYDGTVSFFTSRARTVMARLFSALPAWLACVRW